MEFENSNSPPPCTYMTAPNSPNFCSRSNSMECYYSAPASPRRRAVFRASDDHPGSSFDEFEFETSKRYSESTASGDGGQEGGGRHHERGDSLPAMAFADELFFNGLVMPLKPPPRVHSSPLSSPKSPRTVCRIPFARKSSWNDDFDPFMVALEKVREEETGRNSHHRRSRSYSPFRMRAVTSKSSSVADDGRNRDLDSPMEPMPTSYSGHLEFKGSAYARWVRDQTRHGLSPQNPRGSLFRQRVRPVKSEQDVSAPPAGKKCGNGDESKVQKLKGLLVRYASFGRAKGGNKQTKTSSEVRKLSYFGRVSFKFKGNAYSNNNSNSNSKKKIPAETKMAIVKTVQHKPSIAFCLGYGVGSPIKAK